MLVPRPDVMRLATEAPWEVAVMSFLVAEDDVGHKTVSRPACRNAVDGHAVVQQGHAGDLDLEPAVHRFAMPVVEHGAVKRFVDADRGNLGGGRLGEAADDGGGGSGGGKLQERAALEGRMTHGVVPVWVL